MLAQDELYDGFIKMLLALALGTIVGLEREFHRHPGGLCTHILVTMGSTIYTMISIKIVPQTDEYRYNGDVGRIAAQIVTGIGFIGAGTVYKSDNYVKGLNTAATIWSSASIGMAIGADLWELALIASIMILFILSVNNMYRRNVRRKRKKRERANQINPLNALPNPNTIVSDSKDDSDGEYNNNEDD